MQAEEGGASSTFALRALRRPFVPPREERAVIQVTPWVPDRPFDNRLILPSRPPGAH